MRLDSQCILCLLKRHAETAAKCGTEEQVTAFTRDLMRMICDGPVEMSAPFYTPGITKLFTEHFGLADDRFADEKEASNRYALERFDKLTRMVRSAPDPLYAGLQAAILGNYIDFSALQGQVSFEKLETLLDEAEDMVLDKAVYESLCADLKKGRKLLYLTDNAGEIGFDRVFAEEICKRYPNLEITFCVRSAPAMNDATAEDAALVGIPFPVIGNGNRIAGTQIDQLSREAKTALETADVIIAKGQGNTETMYGCGYNVYYAFLIKCPRFEEVFGKPHLTPMLVRDPG